MLLNAVLSLESSAPPSQAYVIGLQIKGNNNYTLVLQTLTNDFLIASGITKNNTFSRKFNAQKIFRLSAHVLTLSLNNKIFAGYINKHNHLKNYHANTRLTHLDM